MRKLTILLTIALLFSCTNKPTPVTQAANPADRPAIAILYVGLPQVYVRSEPSPNSVVSTAYRYAETVSVLSVRGDWAEVRTVSGSGWVERRDLLTSQAMQELLNATEPRFLTPAATVPARAKGEIVLRARVNTDGEVFEVKTVSNTTGNEQLALDNAAALQQARFYPMMQKGLRAAFTYDHKVTY